MYGLVGFVGFPGYFFLGAYLYELAQTQTQTQTQTLPRWTLANISVFLTASAFTMLATYQSSVSLGKPSGIYYGYLSFFVLLASAVVFNLLIQVKITNAKLGGGVRLIAQTSLGIYCVHVFIIIVVNKLGLSGATSSPWWSIPVTAIAVFSLSFFVIFAMRQVKLLRHVC